MVKASPALASPKAPRPQGQLKLAQALSRLLEGKSFNAITTAEIAKTAGVNEALIYRYFNDKRGLLHYVLHEYLEEFVDNVEKRINELHSTPDRLRVLIQMHIQIYHQNRVLAKILLLEVRNFPGYFESVTYQLVKRYGILLNTIIKEGVEKGEIRDDIPPSRIRDLVLGGIEHFCMGAVIFDRDLSPAEVATDLFSLILKGLQKT